MMNVVNVTNVINVVGADLCVSPRPMSARTKTFE